MTAMSYDASVANPELTDMRQLPGISYYRAVGEPAVLKGPEAAKRYVELITGSSATPVCFRLVYDAPGHEREARRQDGQPILTWGNRNGSVDECIDYLESANASDPDKARQAVHMVVNEGGHTKAEICKVRALFIDADVESGKGIPLEQVHWHQPATFIVTRGNNYHAYWLADEDFSLNEFSEVQRRLAKFYGSDPVINDLCRIMRVPGFMHLKDLKCPQMVELVDPLAGATGKLRDALLITQGLIYDFDLITKGLPELEENQRDKDRGGNQGNPDGSGETQYPPMSLDEARYYLSFIHPAFDGDDDGPVYKDWAGRVKTLLYDPEALPLQDEFGELIGAGHPQREALVRQWCDKTLWNERTGETGTPETYISWEHIKAEIKNQPSRGKPLIHWGSFIYDAQHTAGYIPFAQAKLPLIRIVDGQMHKNVTALDSAFANARSHTHSNEPAVFRQAGRFVVIDEEEELSEGRSVDSTKAVPVVTTLTLPRLRILAARHTRLEKHLRSGGWVSATMPDNVGSSYLQSGEAACPLLNGVIEAPTLLRDGSILQTEGYDPASGLLARFACEFSPVPERPSHSAAKAALKRLLVPFRAVEFESGLGTGIDAYVIVAAILTGVVRQALPIAPMSLISASQPGSGKSLTAQAICVILTGHGGEVITLPGSEEEAEKRLGAALMAGRPVIIVDNCSHALSGDFLCVMLTASKCHPRRLGASENVQCSTRVLMIATGNNLTVEGDLAGRCVISYNRPQTEVPQKREFDFDLLEEVARDRPELVVAALTIARGYIAANYPKVDGAKSSRFPQWDRFVRFPIIWAGGCDIQPAMDKVLNEDPKLVALGIVLQAWHALYGETEKILADVIADLKLHDPVATPPGSEEKALRDAILEAVPGRGPTRDARELGTWFRNKDKVRSGMLELRKGDTTKRGVLWSVTKCSPEG